MVIKTYLINFLNVQSSLCPSSDLAQLAWLRRPDSGPSVAGLDFLHLTSFIMKLRIFFLLARKTLDKEIENRRFGHVIGVGEYRALQLNP